MNLSLVLTCLLAADPGAIAVSYEGQLTRFERGQPAAVVKEFTARTVYQPLSGAQCRVATLVQESTQPLPWPEQFTVQSIPPEGEQLPVVIGYRHADRPYVIQALFPLFTSPQPLALEASWETAGATFAVIGEKKVNEVPCWEVESVTGPARRHRLLVRKDLPLIESLRQTVFMGQGDRFELSITRTASEELTGDAWTAERSLQEQLTQLQIQLQRNPDDRAAGLTQQQVQAAAKLVPGLVDNAQATPYAAFVTAVQRDQQLQMQRVAGVAELGAKFVGQQAPRFTLTRLD
ncbi:MAG: hypothetical protein KDA58_15965, partial [Planctomycetaceae bacterium]|nr:hypothetical protein [Planctomycetaceae bacterium]